jgi:NAD(P)-dependent dehydrogenase (short-subunit alcohol dehydrogenase family)
MSQLATPKPVCVVVGVGPGNGAAFARRFAAAGYKVALLARQSDFSRELAASLPDAQAYACDVADEAAVDRTFARIREELGEAHTLIYNAGSGVWGTLEQLRPADFENSWRVNTLGVVLVTQRIISAMRAAGRGNIVLVGASASRRGRPKTAAFAAAKAAQRSLAESMAREYWPLGVHVALLILDGVVDLPRTRQNLPDKPDEFFIQPADVAEVAYQVTEQRRSAWSFEVEARPFGETW